MEQIFWVSLILIASALLAVRFVKGVLKAVLVIGSVASVLFVIYVVVFGTTESVIARFDGEFGRMVESGSPQFKAVVSWLSNIATSIVNLFKESL